MDFSLLPNQLSGIVMPKSELRPLHAPCSPFLHPVGIVQCMVYPCSGSAQTPERGEAKAAAPPCFRVAMPQQQPEAKCLYILTESPAGWPLATVIDAFGELAADTACNPV